VRVRGVGRLGRVGTGVAGVAVCGALVAGVVSPVWAGQTDAPGAPPAVELGAFAVGDGLEGAVDETDGSFGVMMPAAGLNLSWDSRVPGNRYGFGPGWGLGFAVVDVVGGVQVFPSSGGVFRAAESVPSGLSGYAGADVVFRQTPEGVLTARADGVVGEQPYAFELHESGGTVTYFSAAGDPLAKLGPDGVRSDWRWAPGGSHRLVSVVGVDGVVTELDWSDPGRVVIRPGVNVPGDGGGAGAWGVELDAGRVVAVTDPAGGRSIVRYDDAGRVARLVSGSGAMTAVEWRSDLDGVSRVDRISVADRSGTELSARSWRQVSGVLPSGWPVVDPAITGTVGAGGARSVEVSDGKTRVVSELDEWGRLSGKRAVVSTDAGELVVQEQRFTYPEHDPVGAGDLSQKPVTAELRSMDAAGGVRVAAESYLWDGSGRMLRRESADGTVMERVYDAEVPAGRMLPVGAVVSERSTAPDGSVVFSRSVLDDSRSIPVLVEQGMQAPGAGPVITGRAEYTVRDGVIVEERVFPGGDAGAEPLVTRWDEAIDLARGVRVVSETVAAGTVLAATSSSVASLLHGGGLESTDVLGRVSSAEYDAAGRPVSSTLRDGDAADAPPVQTIAYDITVSGQVGRETTTVGTTGDATVREFTYSPVGALDAITTTRPDGTKEIETQVHDVAGNRLAGADGATYEWDALNRQVAETRADGTRIATDYWSDGSRKRRTSDAGSTTYYWDGGSLINDVHATDAGGTTDGVASYLLGATRHARTTHPAALGSGSAAAGAPAADTQYYSTDRHGNVTELTDSRGSVTGRYRYSDYGTATASAPVAGVQPELPGAVGDLEYNPFQYAMEYTHADGTQFLSERTYDPANLGFTSRDREALHDQYGYANANPIMLVDPSGRFSIKDGFALAMNGLGALGGLVGAAYALGTAFSGGGLGLVLFGFSSLFFSVGDAMVSVAEMAAIVTEERFMDEDVALGLGAALMVGGLGLAAGGRLLTRTSTGSSKAPDPPAAGSAAPEPEPAAPIPGAAVPEPVVAVPKPGAEGTFDVVRPEATATIVVHAVPSPPPPPSWRTTTTKIRASSHASWDSGGVHVPLPISSGGDPRSRLIAARKTAEYHSTRVSGRTPLQSVAKEWGKAQTQWREGRPLYLQGFEGVEESIEDAWSASATLLFGVPHRMRPMMNLVLPDTAPPYHAIFSVLQGVERANARIDRFLGSLTTIRTNVLQLPSSGFQKTMVSQLDSLLEDATKLLKKY